MAIRPFRVCIPVLVEDQSNPRALAIHSSLALTVEAESAPAAVQRLTEYLHQQILPVSFTIVQRLVDRTLHMYMRVNWRTVTEGDGEDVHHSATGRFEGLDLERGVVRFTFYSAASGGPSRWDRFQTTEIPFDDIEDEEASDFPHQHMEDISDEPRMMEMTVAGHFEYSTYEFGGTTCFLLGPYVPAT